MNLTYPRDANARYVVRVANDAGSAARDTVRGREDSRFVRWWLPLLIAGIAVIVRLAMTHQAGGLYAALNPDEGAYYGASLGLVNGLLPYRDLLLLHPPGIAVLLAPFAALSQLTGEPDSLAIMRLGVVLLGGLNTALVYGVARRVGTPAAISAALFYAVWFPAARVERTSLLEPFVITAILVALLVSTGPRVSNRRLVVGGLVVGVLASTKMYSLVPLGIIVVALLFNHGWRRAGTFLLALAGGFVAVCLPFFILAPGAMFRMVLTDQLGRDGETYFWARMRDILALTELDPSAGAVTMGTVALVAVITVIACIWIPPARLWAALLVAQLGVLLSAPNLFINYTAYTSATLALLIGGVAQVVCGGVGAQVRPIRFVTVTLAVCLFAGLGFLNRPPAGYPFPATDVSAAVNGASCVTADSATALILTNTFHSNLANGCPVVVDFTGQVYETRGYPLSRSENPEFQRLALEYLNRGERVIITRQAADGFTPETLANIQRRPILYTNKNVTVYGPLP